MKLPLALSAPALALMLALPACAATVQVTPGQDLQAAVNAAALANKL